MKLCLEGAPNVEGILLSTQHCSGARCGIGGQLRAQAIGLHLLLLLQVLRACLVLL